MATENKVVVGARGDFGNPNGTGLSKLTVVGMGWDTTKTFGDKVTLATAFFAALKAAQLTACNQADVSTTTKSPFLPAKPDADCNVDRVVVVDWRLKTESAPHQFTLPGVPETSTSIDDLAEGERLNEAGKAAVAAAIEAMFELTAGDVVVIRGKVIQKK